VGGGREIWVEKNPAMWKINEPRTALTEIVCARLQDDKVHANVLPRSTTNRGRRRERKRERKTPMSIYVCDADTELFERRSR